MLYNVSTDVKEPTFRLTMDISGYQFFANDIYNQGERGRHVKGSWLSNHSHTRHNRKIGLQQRSNSSMGLFKGVKKKLLACTLIFWKVTMLNHARKQSHIKEIHDTNHLFQLILRATESTPNIQNLHIKPKPLL